MEYWWEVEDDYKWTRDIRKVFVKPAVAILSIKVPEHLFSPETKPTSLPAMKLYWLREGLVSIVDNIGDNTNV